MERPAGRKNRAVEDRVWEVVAPVSVQCNLVDGCACRVYSNLAVRRWPLVTSEEEAPVCRAYRIRKVELVAPRLPGIICSPVASGV